MRVRSRTVQTAFLAVAVVACLASHGRPTEDDAYLSWTEEQAKDIGKRMTVDGRVGGLFDGRIIHTERSYNYRLRATWLTPEVIWATARIAQLRDYLTDDETKGIVAEAEGASDTVILVEIDPQEGSGVIPRDWVAVLRPKDSSADSVVRGKNTPRLRRLNGLAGTAKRDYAYDRFWVVFPLVDPTGHSLLPNSTDEAELIVRIAGKEGRVTWRIPESIRERTRGLIWNRESSHSEDDGPR